jgi:hypothetical protein
MLAFLLAAAGCTGKKPDEQPQKPAAEQSPAPAPAAQPAPEQPTQTRPAPARPEAVPQRPKQEPSPSPAAEPPALVPEARKPEPTRPPEAKPTPKEEAKPAAAESKTAVARDVVVLTGSPLGGVRFEHKLHAARAASNCAACHHASRKEKPATAPQQACSDCHSKAAAPPMKTRYQAAFHNPTAQSGICIDCHKAESAKAKKAPLKCVECHKKENK